VPRLKLSAADGFLLDYWLFLHSNDTHSIWRARPMGSKFIASTTLSTIGSHRPALIRYLESELLGLRMLNDYFPEHCPDDAPFINKALASSWKRWLSQSLTTSFREELFEAMVDAIAKATTNKNYSLICFLLRRIASELADEHLPAGSLISAALEGLLTGTLDRSGSLRAIFLPKQKRPYVVRFAVTKVSVPKLGRLGREKRTSYVFDGNIGEAKVLIGIRVRVQASDASQAVSLSTAMARDKLEHLRLRYYVDTSFCGPVEVEEEGSPAEKQTLPLNHPFWRMRPGLRPVPMIPGDRRIVTRGLSSKEQPRWSAATWHISGALSRWSEDLQTSASEVWHALEAFAGGRKHIPSVIVDKYFQRLPWAMLAQIAMKVDAQRSKYFEWAAECDWYRWNSEDEDASQWAAKLLSPRSAVAVERWSRPVAPLVLYERTTGLLQPWHRSIRNGDVPTWARQRMAQDLSLLYAIRNAAVHEGVRIGNDEVAQYLSRLGLELLYDEMAERARSALASSREGQSVIVDG
jgi:hypothetical protein